MPGSEIKFSRLRKIVTTRTRVPMSTITTCNHHRKQSPHTRSYTRSRRLSNITIGITWSRCPQQQTDGISIFRYLLPKHDAPTHTVDVFGCPEFLQARSDEQDWEFCNIYTLQWRKNLNFTPTPQGHTCLLSELKPTLTRCFGQTYWKRYHSCCILTSDRV